MRNMRPDSIQEAVRASITAAGGLEAASNDLGLSVTTLSRASGTDDDRPGGLGVNYLHTLGRVVPASAASIAQHFARLHGGVYVPPFKDGPMSSNINTLTREFSDVLNAYTKAHSEESENPNDFTPAEARTTAREAIELAQHALAFASALEEKFK
ncbi:hypothetical protein [Ruegeria arenilitoris]|uniref:hypothetical protein n=1 Tax=Ruegeria arenilitoris TaxID=1173585 RepID=UPI00147B49D9|nr:hypothetical protein [Ruegeria arenilitoris]